MEDAAAPGTRSWRRYSAEFKSRVIELARQPGISMAAVAMANGLNANMLRRWVKQATEHAPASAHKTASGAVTAFVQLPMPQEVAPAPVQPPEPGPRTITVEIRRSNTTVQADLPLDGRSAAWLREVLG